jgi:uncharacterized membrane protein YeaQ/YmgE (transglycosylase-associated protein family)
MGRLTGALIMGLLAFILFGAVIGLVARAVMPARESMGLIATTLLAMAGSFIGGIIGSVIQGDRMFALHPPSIIGSVSGAVFVMLLVGLGGGRRATV